MGSKDGSIRIFNQGGQFLKTLGNASKAVTSLCCTSRYLSASSEDCNVYVFDLSTHKLVHTIKHAHWVNSVTSNCDYLVRYGINAIIRLFDIYKV